VFSRHERPAFEPTIFDRLVRPDVEQRLAALFESRIFEGCLNGEILVAGIVELRDLTIAIERRAKGCSDRQRRPPNREYDHEKESDGSYNQCDKSTSFGSEAGSMPRVIFERV